MDRRGGRWFKPRAMSIWTGEEKYLYVLAWDCLAAGAVFEVRGK
jgi:hypothetical protein